jgi:hypothetical protein
MGELYRSAYREGETVLYLDAADRKYAAKKGNLAWRINNPGLVSHHCHFAKKNGCIGAWEGLAIFSSPIQGHQALKEWLHSKKMCRLDLYAIGKHYQPAASKQFINNLAKFSGIPPNTKLKDLTHAEFELLLSSIEKLCGFVRTGSEEFLLLPKIAAKIEFLGSEDLYLVGSDVTLTRDEAINWIVSHRLDAVIVRHSSGSTYVRSRPRYHMQIVQLMGKSDNQAGKEPDTLARAIGKKVSGQCIWGFINGIRNSREEAIESCQLISSKAGNEQVFALRNDRVLQGIKEVGVALLLKMGADTPVVKNAVHFLRYLLSLSAVQDTNLPVIVFAHSQGAAIAEHAMALLSEQERQKIRIFTFGGWSFIAPGSSHAESHNYASIGDLIPRVGSINLQYLAMRKYEGIQKGWDSEKITEQLAFGDAIHDLDCLETPLLEKYVQKRCNYYRCEFEKINNVTILDSVNTWEHSFNNDSYQSVVREIIGRYRAESKGFDPSDSQNSLIESSI